MGSAAIFAWYRCPVRRRWSALAGWRSPRNCAAGLGRMLMDLALRRCREEYPDRPVALRAQIRLAPFYRSFGFAVTSEPFDDFGVTHVEMALRPVG